MQGDFERVTFDPADGFSSVLLQQGRLLLPADFNELGAIMQHAFRQFIVDSKGPDWQVGKGFEIEVTADSTLKFKILPGVYYVDGFRCENLGDLEYGKEQPFWRKPDALDAIGGNLAIIYLHCWERHVTWLQNSRLRDVALGGRDTASRVQVVWQVRAESNALGDRLENVVKALETRHKHASAAERPAMQKRIDQIKELKKLFESGTTPEPQAGLYLHQADTILTEIDAGLRPEMWADAKQDVPDPDPCAIASDAEYRGRDNQLYRVEVHNPGTAQDATIKWSRENGSTAFRVLEVVVGDKDTHVTLESLGHDRRSGVCEGDWVELIDDDLELGWTTTPLQQISKIDVQRRTVTLKGKAVKPPDPQRHALLRRWDHRPAKDVDGAIPVVEGTGDAAWIDLERGIKIRFKIGGYYRKGDFWNLTARAAIGDLDWPAEESGQPKALPPHGITHHRAVLALVTKSAAGQWKEL